MEDNDNFILEFIGALNLRKRVKRKIKWKLIIAISFMIIIFLIFLIIICLASENTKMKRILLREKGKQDKISFNIFNNDYMANVINFNKIQYPIKENEIHVSYSLDSKLIYPTYISMLSGLVNCNESSILVFHLLLSFNFNTSEISIFETLKETYKVKIFYYIIPNIFSRSPRWTAGTDCVYYKILLPFLFPDLKRIIYLDGDTLIRKDISEMYNYPFNDNYILGFPFYTGYIMKRYGINKPKHYINGGCLLFNIKKIRKDHKEIDFLSLTFRNNSKWLFREQDVINYSLYPKIGFLPLKYGMYMIGSKYTFKALASRIYSPLNFTEAEEAIKDPSIVHFSCCWPKVWTNGTKNLFKSKEICLRYQEEFYFYANKTKYYQIIFDTYFYKQKKKKKN
jgi:lipopolysaccharide biosynthesis glycosyltransferase